MSAIVTEASRADAARQAKRLNPGNDGWETEEFSSQASKQLKHLGALLTSDQPITASATEGIVAAGSQSTPLIPTDLVPAFHDASIVVARPESLEQGRSKSLAATTALDLVRQRFQGATDRNSKFKLYRIQVARNRVITRQFFAISGRMADKFREQNAEWRIEWSINANEKPIIERIYLEDFEEVENNAKSPWLFSDCTKAVCGEVPGFRDHLGYGINYWQRRIEKNLSMHYFGHNGLAIGDVNGDGWDDLYVCQPAGIPNKLLVQQSDGTVRDMAADAGVDVLNASRGTLLIDVDNDGDQDLLVTTALALLVFENDGRGSFRLAKNFMEYSGGYTLSSADYDNDGDLDVYICVYYRKPGDARALAYPIPYHDANNGGHNFLLRNDSQPNGKIAFVDVTKETGIDTDNHRFSFASTWNDFDQDGDQDIYVANDYGRNCLYRNTLSETGKATFESVADRVGLADTAFGMSSSWGDINNDGTTDLYIGNMFSGAGNRIAFQERFQQHAPGDIKAKLQRTARGNSLFLQGDNGRFNDVSIPSRTFQGRWAWSSILVDANNDGWEDIAVANGFVTGKRLDDL